MKTFPIKKNRLNWAAAGAAAALILPGVGRAQYFDYSSLTTGRGALLAGFRIPGSANYELVVNLGNITNFLALPAGATIAVSNVSPARLSDAFSSYNNLQWSACATFSGPPNSTWAGFQLDTIWFTLPRADTSAQTSPPPRRSNLSQDDVRSKINSIGSGAHTISINLGTTNTDNNLYLVRELIPDSSSLSVFIGNPTDPTIGDFGSMPSTVENTTPASFTTSVRSDLYQSVPSGYVDPETGATNGTAYYMGYFTLDPAGTMTFTRASAAVATPPQPRIVQISRAGSTSTIFFTTTNGGFIYSLHFTNAAGLTAPATTWPVSGATIIGDGATNQLSDTTTASDRIYRVSVH